MTDIMIWMAVLISGMTVGVRQEADADAEDIRFERPQVVAKPIPCGPDAPTRSNFVARVAGPFYLRFTVEPFLASPEAAAPYAAEAEQVLREAAVGLACGWRSALNDHYARAEALAKDGCTDPVIAWMQAQHLSNNKKQADAKKQLASLLDTLKDAPALYAPLRALTLMSLRGLDGKTYTEETLADALAALLTDGTFQAEERRVAWRFLERCDMEGSPALLAKLRSAAHPPDPFLMLMLEGEVDYKRAWNARGGGYANTVTQEGWEGYGESIEKARAAFTRAWELHPDIPESANQMIRSSRGDAAACRMWFDRAVAAEFDFISAYSSYVFTLYPRWGGSLSEMLAFAEECRATERHDTDVPLRYVSDVFAIAKERQDAWQEVFNSPGVYANCTNILERCLARPGLTHWLERQYFNTALAYMAYAAGDYDAAGRAVKALPVRWGSQPFYNTNIRPAPPFSDIVVTLNSAMNGPNKNLMRAADQQTRGGDPEDAFNVFESIWDNPAVKLGEYERYGIAYLEMDLARRVMLASGDWCSLIRPHTAKVLHGAWVNYYNGWRFSNMTFRAEGGNALLSFLLPMPREIEYEVAFTPLPADPQTGCSFGFSLDAAFPGDGTGPALWLAREKGKWSAVWVRRFGAPRLERERRFSEKHDLPSLPPDGTILLSITSKGDAVSAAINGEAVFKDLDLSDAFYDSLRAGRLPYLLGSRVAVTTLKARPLKPAERMDK